MPVIAPFWSPSKLLLSISAGVTIDTYLESLRPKFDATKVVRVMPNTSLLVGESAGIVRRSMELHAGLFNFPGHLGNAFEIMQIFR